MVFVKKCLHFEGKWFILIKNKGVLSEWGNAFFIIPPSEVRQKNAKAAPSFARCMLEAILSLWSGYVAQHAGMNKGDL